MVHLREFEISGNKITIQELDDVYNPLTGRALTGSWVWDSALVLSQWMLTQGRVELDLQGKTVIELGAGTGIPGLIAALLGATRVILTDIAPLLPGLQRNVEVNRLGDRVEVRELVWGSDESWCPSDFGEVDLVLMSDVLYDVSEMAALGKTLKRMCGKGTRIWSASEVRSCTGECLNELMCEGFGVIELPSSLGSPSLSTTTTEMPLFAVCQLVLPETSCESEFVGPSSDYPSSYV